MVVPVDPQVDEAQYIAEQDRHERAQSREIGTVGRLQLENHDRDDDRQHTIAECLQPTLAHQLRLSLTLNPPNGPGAHSACGAAPAGGNNDVTALTACDHEWTYAER